MRVYGWFGSFVLCVGALPLCAQQGAQQGEPGTASTQVGPASQAPKTITAPNLRVDSKPHTDLDPSTDSAPTPMDLGLGVTAAPDLGHDLIPITPPGMLARAVPGNPSMRYYSLPRRAGDAISAGDQQIIAGRQAELGRRAGNLEYQQVVCPAMQPDAENVTGVPPGGDGQGFILLHSLRSGSGASDGDTVFSAVVPRTAGQPVRVLPAAGPKTGKKVRKTLNSKNSRTAVNEALPPETLYANLQPVGDWIAASACIAALGGASPQIPNEPDLGENIVTAPSPMLKLRLDGSREMIFSDRVNEGRYVIWDTSVSPRGRMQGARERALAIKPLAIRNPTVPEPRLLPAPPDPPTRMTPPPPSPISGDHQ